MDNYVDVSSQQEMQVMNLEIRKWAKQTRMKMKSRIISHGVQDNMTPGELTEDLKASTGMRDGVVDKISFKFPRYGVWFEKGASKGHAGNKGRTRWQKASGGEGSVNPNSVGKMNSGARKAKPWFNEEITKAYDGLSEIVLRGHGRITLKKLKSVLMR